jgi:hypothetical protein
MMRDMTNSKARSGHTKTNTTTNMSKLRALAPRALVVAAAVAAGVAGTSGVADAATGTTGRHYVSSAECNPRDTPSFPVQNRILLRTPTIYAANTTSGLDGQYVRFRQRVERWNGSRGTWDLYGYSHVYEGFATDSKAGVNFKDLTTGQTIQQPSVYWDLPNGASFYRGVTEYRWNPSSTGAAGTDVLAAYHSDTDGPARSNAYCTFNY